MSSVESKLESPVVAQENPVSKESLAGPSDDFKQRQNGNRPPRDRPSGPRRFPRRDYRPRRDAPNQGRGDSSDGRRSQPPRSHHHNNQSEGRVQHRGDGDSVSPRYQKRYRSGRRPSEGSHDTGSSSSSGTGFRALRDDVMASYNREGLNLLNSYIRNRLDLAKFQTISEFLLKCEMLTIVPDRYVLTNNELRKTKFFIRTLERYSFQIMKADFRYNRKRSSQIQRLLVDKTNRMKEMFEDETVDKILKLTEEHYERKVARFTERHTKTLESLIKEYSITEEELEEAEQRRIRFEEREKERQERWAIEREQRKALKNQEQPPSKEGESSENKKAEE